MSVVFVLTLLLSVPMMILGLIRPRWALPKFMQPTRKKVFWTYSGVFLGSFALIAATVGTEVDEPLPQASPSALPSSPVETPVVSSPIAEPSLSPLSPTSTAAEAEATVQPKGLGVTRTEVQNVFERPQTGFTFEQTNSVHGQPAVLGKAPNNLALLQLVGNPELTEAAIMIFATNDNPQANTLNSVYMLGFVGKLVPEWSRPSDWISENLEKLVNGETEEATISQGGKQISMTTSNELGMIVLTVKPE